METSVTTRQTNKIDTSCKTYYALLNLIGMHNRCKKVHTILNSEPIFGTAFKVIIIKANKITIHDSLLIDIIGTYIIYSTPYLFSDIKIKFVVPLRIDQYCSCSIVHNRINPQLRSSFD